jgi:hypothetical protein
MALSTGIAVGAGRGPTWSGSTGCRTSAYIVWRRIDLGFQSWRFWASSRCCDCAGHLVAVKVVALLHVAPSESACTIY